MGKHDTKHVNLENQTILTAIPDLILRLDRNGYILEHTPATGTPLLLKIENYTGKNLFDVMPQDIAQQTLDVIKKTASTHKSTGFDYQLEIDDNCYDYEARIVELMPDREYLNIVRDVTEQKQILHKLTKSEAKFRALFEHANDAIFLIADGKFIECNSKALEMFTCQNQDIIGKTLAAFSPPQQADGQDSSHIVDDKIQAAIKGVPQRFEWIHCRLDGSVFDAEVSLNAINLGDEIVIQAIIRDITERKQQEHQVGKLNRILEQTADIVIVTNLEGLIEYVNPAFEETTGFSAREVIGRTPNFLVSGKHKSEFYTNMWNTILAGKNYNNVMINRRKDGSLYYEEKTITPIKDSAGNITHFVSTAKDISDHIEIQERLQHMTHHDVLTDLPNRNLLLDRLQQALIHARSHDRMVAIMFMDLDRFKNINDTLGHNIGDQLLLQLSERIRNSVRDGDTIARFGGDEFAILMDDIESESHISAMAQKLLDTLVEPFRINKHELHVTASIGVSIYPGDGDVAETLLRNADVAMYRAKDLGKNNYQFYSDDMSARIFERLTLENNLRHALDRNEFIIHYQPQIDARTEHITGVEALLRWQHPDLGLVLPNNFIPLLEETGLIEDVGNWVLKTCCKQLREWHDTGLDTLQMSVNISSRQFNNANFISVMHEMIKETGVNSEYLELELTESMFLRNASATISALNSLSNIGVRFAIDDFGTGYSSLSYLRRFPIDTIKIDRSFIRDITEDSDDAAITSAIVVMAQSLSLNVIAEGVETDKQLEFLREHNCNNIQGYHYCHPLPEQQITKLLQQKH
ncbi:MAG: EAL domain-containing protein [Proteobacteria bacterium]|jgi:diguanylate cyclase (GGDEF)-like protein/PAS domain S-box-containing protein|nr:EAL domain-containing protein [Pseudomonadota bacterium]